MILKLKMSNFHRDGFERVSQITSHITQRKKKRKRKRRKKKFKRTLNNTKPRSHKNDVLQKTIFTYSMMHLIWRPVFRHLYAASH